MRDSSLIGFNALVEGAKTRNIAVRKAIELAATTDDGTANAMKESMKEYFVYDNSFVVSHLPSFHPHLFSLLR